MPLPSITTYKSKYSRNIKTYDKWLYDFDTMTYIKILYFDDKIGVYHHTIQVELVPGDIKFKYLGIQSDFKVFTNNLKLIDIKEEIKQLDVIVAKSLLLEEHLQKLKR